MCVCVCVCVCNSMQCLHVSSVTGGALASFPGSSAWAEKKEPGTHCLRMFSSPRISGNLEIFRKICSVTLTSARYADFSLRSLSLTTLCVDDDEGATKVLSSSLAGIVHVFVHSS